MNTPLQTFTRLACAFGLLAASASQAQVTSVGMRQIQSNGMPITLVYPTAAAAQDVTYGAFTVQIASNAALLPAPSSAAKAKRALIVLSHGTAGSALPDHTLAATLARAGFVVAQPEHRGDNWQDFSRAGPESWKTRPQDVSETIDAVARDPALAELVDTRSVGVHGMSAGGVTGLVLAGAQWRMLDLVQHCAQHQSEDIGFCLNGLGGKTWLQLQRKTQFFMAKVLTENNAPDNLKVVHGGNAKTNGQGHDPRPDPRVVAVSLAVPIGAIFTPESLARIRIPVALSTAGSDSVLLPRFHSQHVLKHCTSCTTLSDHPQSGHFDWLSPWPASVAQTVAATQMRGGMPKPEFTDADRQQAFDQIAVFFIQKL
ncbi:prolyl oligopeptidase family serine peptidase [Limnohabitans sp. Bal53]|uniref:alpha/beta hydrolase family protein n=1 Tax=Limnohabitans sp. Bal53 TaxID=1977910 RepID=UPI000D34D0B9|nr:prolyl oligopeptidase family serine peptidase [Limnohabitans sp. Bal53]